MKSNTKSYRLVAAAALIILDLFLPACATQSGIAADRQIQSALVAAGFKTRRAETPQQRERLQPLPEHQLTVVNQNGQNFYVWADKPNGLLYCGNEQAYRNYQQNRKAQQDRESGAITWIAEPRGVPVTVFYGWAPFREW
jgi:hypothetical protein